jgi:hypothetical protein
MTHPGGVHHEDKADAVRGVVQVRMQPGVCALLRGQQHEADAAQGGHAGDGVEPGFRSGDFFLVVRVEHHHGWTVSDCCARSAENKVSINVSCSE